MRDNIVNIGGCTLINGDCYEWIKKNRPPRCLVTDPPYEFKTSGGGKFRKDRPNMDEIAKARLDKGFDHTFITPFMFDSVIVFCHNDQIPILSTHIATWFDRLKILPWIKTNPLPVANKNYQPCIEYYLHGWNMGFHPSGGLSDLQQYYIGKNGKDQSIKHPTSKPDKLMDKIIKNANSEDIFDPFMGSGSTAIACMKAGKRFVGIEKVGSYFDESVERVRKFYDSIKGE